MTDKPAPALPAVEAQLAELRAIKESRERIHAQFRTVDQDGKCRCCYCRGDADDLAELAASYELDLWEKTKQIQELEAALERRKLAAWRQMQIVEPNMDQHVGALRAFNAAFPEGFDHPADAIPSPQTPPHEETKKR